MESLIVSTLVQLVLNQLASPIFKKIQNYGGFKKEMKKLQDKLPIIQAVIEDAEERQFQDKKIRIWLSKLKDVAYDADDLFDEITSQILRRRSRKNALTSQLPLEEYHVVDELHAHYLKMSSNLKEIKDKVCSLTLDSLPNYFRLSRKLKDIRERIDEIAKEIGDFQLKEVSVNRLTNSEERRETGPYTDELQVSGREQDVEKIVSMLLSCVVLVIPIVGIGGIGKTTLAQLVYNDSRVSMHFDLKMWVSGNDDFSPRKVMTAMLNYATHRQCELNSQMGLLQLQLKEVLSGKRYLLVLDDVCNDDPDKWDALKSILESGLPGSKVIVTTRSQNVASITSKAPPYHLKGLTDEECWRLFQKRAFADGEEDVFRNLIPISKEIVGKCKGVPLAAKFLGGLMRFKREESEWLRVQGSELWSLDGGDNGILSVLKLSFNHLPAHLKRCFAYCAVFPKAYTIQKEKLIHQWIAEGLIQFATHAYQDYLEPSLEDIGNSYFNELLRLSFFEEVNACDGDSLVEYKMHDLIHDLAKFVAGNEFVTLGKNNWQRRLAQSHSSSVVCPDYAKVRHILIDWDFISNSIPEPLSGAKKLRTLNVLSFEDLSEKTIRSLISSFKYLRTLNLGGLGIKKLHKSICDLIHLRYLDLSYTLIEQLPDTICHLYKLQTLDLSNCNNLRVLPRRIWEMIDLTHLDIKGCDRLSHLPPLIGQLESLQTLPIFIVGQTLEDNLSQLLHLHDLRGELKIKHLENVTADHLFHIERITSFYPSLLTRVECMQIYTLGLSWGDVDEGKSNPYIQEQNRQTGQSSSSADAETIISLLQPNCCIKRLSINGYRGIQFPGWMNSETLRNLVELKLINCSKCQILPTIGDLQVLKVLHIRGMSSLLSIDNKFYGTGAESFSLLEEFTLQDLPNLVAWESKDRGRAFSRMNQLIIISCPLLISMPQFPCLKQLEMTNCNSLLLRSAAELLSLSTLVIKNFPELDFIPKALPKNNPQLSSLTIFSCPKLCSMPTNFGEFQALKLLRIGWCQELESLLQELNNLTFVETLEIIECPRLCSLPQSIEGLSSLRYLSIENCNGFTSLPISMQHTTALERLSLMYCSNLASLPDNLQYLCRLRSLSILSCTELASLPGSLRFVTTLQHLEIHGCPKFMEMPEWMSYLTSLCSLAISDCKNLNSLPEGFNHLRSLQYLSIRDCPDLEIRCAMGTGTDWQKISHVPYLHVGSTTQ